MNVTSLIGRSHRIMMLLAVALAFIVGPVLIAQAVNYDNNGQAMQVSLYAKVTAAGDTSLVADSSGNLKVNIAAATSGATSHVNIAQVGGAATAAAAALADSTSNPTVGSFGTYPHGWNDTISKWDRLRQGVTNTAATTGFLNVMGGRQFAAADATSNTLTDYLGSVGTALFGYNGTTWDRLRQDNTGALRISVYGKGTVAGDTAVDAFSPASAGARIGSNYQALNVLSWPYIIDASSTQWFGVQSVNNGLNDDGQGITAAGLVAQLDDTSPTNITENNFGNVRMSASRALLVEGRTRYNATLPTLSDAAFNVFQAGTRGGLQVNILDTNGTGTLFPAVAAAADAYSNPTITHVGADLLGFNGTTWDRLRAGDVNNVAAATGYLNALGVGRYNATLPTLTDTRFNALQLGSRGGLHVNLVNTDGTAALLPASAALADNTTNPTTTLAGAMLHVYDGTTWDRLKASATGGGAATLGVVAVGPHLWDGADTFQQLVSARQTSDADLGAKSPSTIQLIFNGTTWDRVRSIINATDSIGTGIQAVGLVAQLDNTSPTTITENQFGNVRMSAQRHLLTSQEGTYATLTTAATSQVKTSAGTLHTVTINTKGTTSTLLMYDNASACSGTLVGTIDTASVVTTLTYNVRFSNGLCIDGTAGGAAANLTISYR